MTVTKENITGLILAGGRGRRMGGVDKGLMSLDGRAMIEYVIERLSPQVSNILISANRNFEHYRELSHRVVSDIYPDYSGPLAGILTGLRKTQTDYLAIVPCDAPLISDTLVARLVAAINNKNSDIAVAHDGSRLQQAFLLMGRRMHHDLEIFLASGERKMETWLMRHDAAVVDFSDCRDSFTNVNDLREFNGAQTLLRQLLQVR